MVKATTGNVFYNEEFVNKANWKISEKLAIILQGDIVFW